MTIKTRVHLTPEDTSYRVWECTTDLRFDPPHHFITGGATAEEAIWMAVQRTSHTPADSARLLG